MKLPHYLTYELVRRLNRDAPARETRALLKALDLSLDEPSPKPDFDDMLEGYDGACQTGSFILEGTLDFIGHKVPMHFRIRYARPNDDKHPWDMIKGPTMDVDALTWQQDAPAWTHVGADVLSDAMIEDIWPAISLHASQQEVR
ncbi:hypothetical protein [Novosphingobium decolorationis]|uniref:Uncharacterized protein n=1 Tax=Novosphingobium decolorationis TaxID=2698673 RepID=A0ABX8EAL7_9SPHN|nr:hypothetical protein [Novosphingobium decolorationis]QVM85250.1 hypothetical protein HT578_17525 [Novosphingobium decolorationis]